MPDQIQPSMSRGELSEGLQGRVDTALYRVALKTARNVVIHATGGASKRPPLKFVAPVKDHTYAPRLIPFKFTNGDEYVLEFGDQYIRFVRADNHVTEDALVVSGATQADPCVITTSTAHGYSNGDEVFIDAIVGMTELNGRRFVIANATSTTFQLTDQLTGADIDATGYTAYSSAGTVAKIYEIASPYAIADVDKIKYSQTADVVRLAHPDYKVRELTRSAANSWAIAEAFFGTGTARPNGLSITENSSGSATVAYKVTAIDADTGEESLAGIWGTVATVSNITQANPAVVTTSSAHNFSTDDDVHIFGVTGMDELSGRDFRINVLSSTTFELVGEDSTNYVAYSSGGNAGLMLVRTTASAEPVDNTVSWSAITNASRYAIYRESNGVFGLVGETTTTSYRDVAGVIDLTISPPEYTDPFRTADNYPSAVGAFEQRQVYGGTNNAPDKSFFSQIGNRNNFNISTPVQDSDAITATLPADTLVEIRHYVSGEDLLVFGANAEFRINSGTDAAFTPSSINQKGQGEWGCSHIRPIKVGKTILFVPEDLESVRDLKFSLEIEGYTGGDLSVFAKHLLEDYTLLDWCFVKSPDPRIHMVRSDGKVITLTLQQEQAVAAWAWWETDGVFERSCVSTRPSTSATRSQAFFVVKRTVNGQTARYIERTRENRFSVIEEACFLDSSLTYDVPITITNVSSGDPIVVTAAAHGLSNGDQVRLFDILWAPTTDNNGKSVQPDQLNRHRYYVANKTTDTFELATSKGDGVDASDSVRFPDGFNAYASGGVVRKCVSTVTGLHHLEGRTIEALADGAVVEGLTVADGAVTLTNPASLIHFGLPYTADVETLDITDDRQIVEGEQKNVTKVTLKLHKSRGIKVGPSEDALVEIKDRGPLDYNRVQNFYSGVEEVGIEEEWNSNGRILIRQKYPLPMTLLYVAPDVDLTREY